MVDLDKIRKTWPLGDSFGERTLSQRSLIHSACDEIDQLRSIAKELAEALSAARAFIDSHVADPDITHEMEKAYERYMDSDPDNAIARYKELTNER